jgi:ATP-dependent helicase/nuclease subunit A
LLARLGPEAGDPIDEFLRLAMSYDEGSPPSLQGFIAAIRASDREIKRDMEHGRNEVRVMTVHGAKGLEAPIVFLPDTCSNSSGGRPGGLLQFESARRPVDMTTPFVWPVKGCSNLGLVSQARDAARMREAAERNRLLYVALTRPRDRLYVAGFLTGKGRLPADCWYDLISRGVNGYVTEMTDDTGRKVLRLTSPQTGPTEVPRSRADAVVEARPLPDWARKAAPREPSLAVPLAPSRLAPLESDEEGDPVDRPSRKAGDRRESPTEPPPLTPGAQADGLRFLRGTITHALLEHLPGLAAEDWKTVATRFVEARGSDLRPKVRKSIVAETLAVLRDPTFAPIFGPASRAEVPIVAEFPPGGGSGPTVRVMGQIDRLVVLDTEVLIVDFKTNRPPPSEATLVADAYLLQLAAYRLAVSRIYPDRSVKAALLWTDGPRLMTIPGAMLDAAELRLFAIEPATDA